VFSNRAMSVPASPTQAPEALPKNPAQPIAQPASHVPAAFVSNIETTRGIDFRHLWHTLLEKVWILAVCTLAGLFLALGYLARTPKLYQGHVVLEVEFAEPTMVA